MLVPRSLGLALALAGTSCFAPQYNDPHMVRASQSARENQIALRDVYGNERGFGRHGYRRPELGLSLSGGGVRSAATSLGFLQGLHEAEILPRVEVLSSVSGGGWAMGWYYGQLYASKKAGRIQTEADMLGDPRYAEAVARYARLFEAESSGQYWASGATTLLGNVISLPFLLLSEGLFEFPYLENFTGLTYRESLEFTYLRNPLPETVGTEEEIQFSNIPGFFSLDGAVTPIELADMAGFADEQNLPLFVFNTTACGVPRAGEKQRWLADVVYEFTPLRYGSEGFGYGEYDEDLPLDFSELLQVSAAAVDSANPDLGLGHSLALKYLALDLGQSIDNPNTVAWASLLPFPFYFLRGARRFDRHAHRIDLSDGGHSENLGAYALVRRMCDTIVILDCGFEAKNRAYGFEDYHKLRRALERENGLELRVPGIDDGGYQLGEVMTGKVRGAALGGDSELDVIYVKLANLDGSTDAGGFPMHPTLDQDFDRELFLRYTALGRALAQAAAPEILASLAGDTSP